MTGKDALAAKNARLCGPETRRMLNESCVAWFMPVANEYPTLYSQSFARFLVQSVKWLSSSNVIEHRFGRRSYHAQIARCCRVYER